ncbi:MAG: flagellar motor switch protein FliN/FliY [Paracoccaceae bacterium]|jgi:flagellar motor switch protein FliN/FliY
MDDSMDNATAKEGGTLAKMDGGPKRSRGSAVLGVPIEVVVSVGRARPMIAELVTLRRDSVLPLDSRIEDPVELYIGDRLIARGELQEMDDDSGRLAVRLTEVADLSGGV